MENNLIGPKKIKYLNRKFKIDIVSGINYLGTATCEVLTRDGKTYTVNPLTKFIMQVDSRNREFLIQEAKVSRSSIYDIKLL